MIREPAIGFSPSGRPSAPSARLWISETTKSGNTSVTLTPASASSTRSASKNPVTACFAAEYAVRVGTPMRPAMLDTATMRPRALFRWGRANHVG